MERIYISKTDLETKIGVFGVLETGLIDGDIVQIVKFNDDLVMVEYIEREKPVEIKVKMGNVEIGNL